MTPQIEEFYTVKTFDKSSLFTRMKKLGISRGFDIQFPIISDSGNKSTATIRCAMKGCPFKIVQQKNLLNTMEEYRILDLHAGHNHSLR